MDPIGGTSYSKPLYLIGGAVFSLIQYENRGKWKKWGWILDFNRIKEFESPWLVRLHFTPFLVP
jgi:hypothetical protein